MLDRYELWHTAAAVLAVMWVRREPAWQTVFGPREGALVIAGALLPLIDQLAAAVLAPDSIAFLARARWMHSLSIGLLGLAGALILAAFTSKFRRAGNATLWLAAGWAGHQALDALTPAGVWLGVAENPAPFDWPAFPEGHVPLIVLLVLGLVALRVKEGWAKWTRIAVWSLAGMYFVLGLAQFGIVSARAAHLAEAGEVADVVPIHAWRTRWLVVLTGGAQHRVGALDGWGAVIHAPSPVPRGNREPRLIALLADPVVRQFYFRVFRHPVAQVVESPAQLTLTLREAGDLDAGTRGPAFTLETDLDGRERVYRVSRFN